MLMVVPCLICDKTLVSVFPDLGNPQAYGAVRFVSRGNYGSAVFDPMADGEMLEINICDNCLLKNKSKVIYCKEIYKENEYERSTWDGKDEEYRRLSGK